MDHRSRSARFGCLIPGLWSSSSEPFVSAGYTVVCEVERPLAKDLLFKTSLQGTWFETEDGYFYGANFAVRELLGPDRAISYELNNQFRTEPSHRHEETALRVRYRQTVWRKWLKFDLVPQLSFPRERDFDATPGIYAGFEISFGG